jgi:nitrous oxide reductase
MLDRRGFLKTVGLATAATAETLGGSNLHAVAETQSEATKPATTPGTPEEPVRVLYYEIDMDRHYVAHRFMWS